MLAWSHIYLGRILDVEEQRDEAIAEYKAALTVRDGQPDTKEAAEAGLKQPFTLPHREQASGRRREGRRATTGCTCVGTCVDNLEPTASAVDRTLCNNQKQSPHGVLGTFLRPID